MRPASVGADSSWITEFPYTVVAALSEEWSCCRLPSSYVHKQLLMMFKQCLLFATRTVVTGYECSFLQRDSYWPCFVGYQWAMQVDCWFVGEWGAVCRCRRLWSATWSCLESGTSASRRMRWSSRRSRSSRSSTGATWWSTRRTALRTRNQRCVWSKAACVYFFMVAVCNRADHYIFILFLFLLSFFFFSSPNLSSRRLDVYHTSAHGVVLV